MQTDEKVLWYFSRNNLPPQTATWGEIKEMVRSKRLRADDLLTPASSIGHGTLQEDGLPAMPGVWQTAEEVFQNLPYEAKRSRPSRRNTVPGWLWIMFVVGLAAATGAWVSIQRNKTSTREEPKIFPVPPPPVKEIVSLTPSLPTQALVEAPGTSIKPKSDHLIIPPELLQFQRYDQPRPSSNVPSPPLPSPP